MSPDGINVLPQEPRTPVSLQLADVVSYQFALVPGDRSARQGRELIGALDPSRVIVRSVETGHAVYHLLSAFEALDLFTAAGDATVRDTLAAAGVSPVPALDASTRADDAPDRCVVLDEGELIGFFDVDLDVPDIQRGHGPEGLEPELAPRLLTAKMEREVEVGRTVSLFLSLATPELVGDSGLPLNLAIGAALDVYVQPRRGFELEGPPEARLLVSEEPETLPVQFRLRAVTVGEARIEVWVFHREACLGRLVVAPTITRNPVSKPQSVRYERELYAGGISEPDLTLHIREIGDRHVPQLLIRLWSAESSFQVTEFGPILLKLGPSQYSASFFGDVEKLDDEDEEARQVAEERLQRKGAALFQSIFPPDLQGILWSLRKRIGSLRIESEEPWIPWELCRLVGHEEGQTVESGFFCEEFPMARWLLGVRRKPALRLRRLGVIAPASSGLANAEEECRQTLGIKKEDLQIESIPCRYLQVLRAFSSGTFDGFHFAGHATYRDTDPNLSRISLDEQEVLTPEDLSGKVANLGRTWPLVFLNACQTGRNSLSLTDLGGWAPKLLDAGAAAFLGTLWEVSDRGAEIFARTFYQELLVDKKPIGEAVRQARLTVRTELPGNSAWLAYTLFADPLARVI